MSAPRRLMAGGREHRSSILVAALSSAFGVVLLQVTDALATMIGADDVSGHGSVAMALAIVAFVFIAIAVYVGAIVTANTFATIIAGRTRTIALLRLVGASSRTLRRAVAGEGFRVGIVGAAAGALIGTGVSFTVLRISVARDLIPDLDYALVTPVVAAPIVIVVLSTWLASWVGSHRVLNVQPIQALGAAQELSYDEARHRPVRNALALCLAALGLAFLAGGVAVGLVSAVGVLIGLIGGLLSFTGLILGAHRVMPPVLRLAARLTPRSAASRLAAANALRYPERSSRATIGLVIGVTLITMFAVAGQSYQDMMHRAQEAQPELYQGVDQVVAVTVAIFSVLIGFSALIAAVGMVNNLALSVLQRTRELGLLRALGFTATQVRQMILAESAQMTIAAVGLGLVLGVFYGWAGAQSLLGWQDGVGLIWPSVPWLLVVACVVGAAALTLVASVSPARRATTVSPIVALAAD
ncbi:ABC transporter permease [Cryobacterium tepidiphilum]|uniref:ABC transporter permease n=1 Tax=Cryobacterium tepidiphilum TaxID=2486026 RepID=A0A3M8KZ21_9MICO|nr:ABC transporter permease [Cryobacterium tepidiphilum]RNE58541.1 ABC transporter permease [Cryobacterium tepidiphilum]